MLKILSHKAMRYCCWQYWVHYPAVNNFLYKELQYEQLLLAHPNKGRSRAKLL